jgi:predicted HicB family RNase H-like nuclease
MTTDKSPILFRVQPELRARLEKAARDQNRSLSNLVETAMTEWAQQNGYLPEPKKKPRA